MKKHLDNVIPFDAAERVRKRRERVRNEANKKRALYQTIKTGLILLVAFLACIIANLTLLAILGVL